jgi:hypothetical protein
MCSIVLHKQAQIGTQLSFDVFAHVDKTVSIHIEPIIAGTKIILHIGTETDARELAAILIAAADAVDPPKQGE